MDAGVSVSEENMLYAGGKVARETLVVMMGGERDRKSVV